MSILAPHLLDVMRGVVEPGSDDLVMMPSEGFVKELNDMYEIADKFDFGSLTHLMTPDRNNLTIPLTEDEKQFWADELIPLPNPDATYFEFSLESGRVGYLVCSKPAWTVIRWDWGKDPDRPERNYYCQTGVGFRITQRMFWATFGIRDTEVFGYPQWLNKMDKAERERFLSGNALNIDLSIYLTLILNSKSTDLEKVQASPKLNKARDRKNREPFPDHTVVSITPSRFYDREEGEGGTHASPRLHWRRSHLRVYRDETGKPYHKVVIPRCLVGKRELGEVTHDYEVKL